MKKILFVCTGNTCRSPMAEAFFNHSVSIDDTFKNEYKALSAGLFPREGEPASCFSTQVMKDNWRINIEKHRARTLKSEDLDSSDLILTMTEGHKYQILSAYPHAKNKVSTIKEYVYTPEKPEEKLFNDVSDPYGASLDVYKQCAEEIENLVRLLIERLKKS